MRLERKMVLLGLRREARLVGDMREDLAFAKGRNDRLEDDCLGYAVEVSTLRRRLEHYERALRAIGATSITPSSGGSLKKVVRIAVEALTTAPEVETREAAKLAIAAHAATLEAL